MQSISRRQFALSAAAVLIARGQSQEDLSRLSLAEASRRIHAKTITPTQLTEACLARIAVYNPKVNAFITVLREGALAQSRELDNEQSAGKFRGPLHGIPIALKDNID
ncbi:MAG TPA: amidase family protein, partial [Bryobacteraceae bacterium]|nr:amidase family protein [Bryobacteraceae bacterium]